MEFCGRPKVNNTNLNINMNCEVTEKETKLNLNLFKEPQFKPKKLPQYYAAVVGNLGGFTMACAFYYSALAIPDMRTEGTLGTLTRFQENWITSILYFSSLLACPLAGFFLLDSVGRRASLLILTFPFVCGWACIALAENLTFVYIGRFITGVCAASYGIIVPVYIAETSQVHIRGTLTCFFEFMICVGTLYIYVVGTYTSWKMLALACGIVPILHHVLLMTLPESPRYLLEKNEPVKALEALQWFRGANSRQDVEHEFSEMQNSVFKNKDEKKGWKSMTDKVALRSVFIGLGLMTFLQLSFINPILTYTVDIFKTAGSYDKYMSTIVIGATQAAVNIVPFFLVDKFGRRVLLLLSMAMTAISLISLGFYFHIKIINEEFTLTNLSWLPLASLIGYVVSCSIGLLNLPWVVVGEIVPSNAKGIASGIISIWSRLVGIASVYFFRDLLDIFGDDGVYWFIASICGLGFIFVYFFLPETKGKSLDEIQADLK